jgi:hypothetical protein
LNSKRAQQWDQQSQSEIIWCCLEVWLMEINGQQSTMSNYLFTCSLLSLTECILSRILQPAARSVASFSEVETWSHLLSFFVIAGIVWCYVMQYLQCSRHETSLQKDYGCSSLKANRKLFDAAWKFYWWELIRQQSMPNDLFTWSLLSSGEYISSRWYLLNMF